MQKGQVASALAFLLLIALQHQLHLAACAGNRRHLMQGDVHNDHF
jgi:hypothetical protein